MKMKNRDFYVDLKTLFIIILLIVVSLFAIPIRATTDNQLTDQYAPILYFEKDKIM